MKAKEITMTWDAAAVEASLPRDSQFTFMDLLAMTGHAPVAVEPRSQVAVAYREALGAIAAVAAGTAHAVAGVFAAINAPAYDFMALLAEKGYVPAFAAAQEPSRFSRLVHWANDNWKAPANVNSAEKAA